LFLTLAHVAAKSLLFLLAGEFSAWTGSSRWDAMRGIGRSRPLAAGLFALASLSIMGMPVFAGFWGKLGIVRASIAAGGPAVIGTVAVLVASVVEGVYFMRITHGLFEAGEPSTPTRLRAAVLIPALLLGAAVLLLGLYPSLVDPIMTDAAAELANPVESYGELFRASGGMR
jgi:multicomponent Na+:H+ antiporter subunit D